MKLSFTGYGRQFDIELNYRVTLVRGNSGVGKTVLYDMLKTASAAGRNDIQCYNLETQRISKKTFKQWKAGMKNKLIVVDNADVVLTADARSSIDMDRDSNNVYLIFGRNNAGMYIREDGFAYMIDTGTRVYFEYPFK